MNRPIEELKFAIEEWTADYQHVSEVLVRASNISVALAAFAEAARVRPKAPLTLRHGARVIESRPKRAQTR